MDSQLKLVFKDFAREVINVLGNKLKSIIIYGSVSLGDFHKGKGDIDFVCIIKNDLTDHEIIKIMDLHDNVRNGSLGELGIQLEGAYYTLSMMGDIKKIGGRGYYIGTNRKGWKEVSSASSLNYTDILMIQRHGIVIAGEENKDYLVLPTKEQIRDEFINKLENYIDLGRRVEDIWLSIEMVYFGVRGLNTVLKGDLLSKAKACSWFCQEYPGSNWKQLVQYTSQFRYPLTEEEESVIDKAFIISSAALFLQDIYEDLASCKSR